MFLCLAAQLRAAMARGALEGHASMATVDAEELLAAVLAKAVPAVKERPRSLFAAPPKPRRAAGGDPDYEPFAPAPPPPGLNAWAGRRGELHAALSALGRRQLPLAEWRQGARPEHPLPAPGGVGVHAPGYAPAVFDPQRGPTPKPWIPRAPRGLREARDHADHLQYKTAHHRAI